MDLLRGYFKPPTFSLSQKYSSVYLYVIDFVCFWKRKSSVATIMIYHGLFYFISFISPPSFVHRIHVWCGNLSYAVRGALHLHYHSHIRVSSQFSHWQSMKGHWPWSRWYDNEGKKTNFGWVHYKFAIYTKECSFHCDCQPVRTWLITKCLYWKIFQRQKQGHISVETIEVLVKKRVLELFLHQLNNWKEP